MPMPSLFKYFAFVGAALFGLLSLANFLLDPSTGATPVATAPAKHTVAVLHDPRASKIERWRDDQAALKAAHQTQTSQNASLVTKSVVEPPQPATTASIKDVKPQTAPQLAAAAPEPAKSQPVSEPAAAPAPALAPAPETAAIVGAESTDEIAAAQAAKVAERKAKVAKAKARKERVARQQTRERYASNQQDQFYYGQRQQQPLVTGYSSAFAPQQQSFGPFNNGGWGRAW